MTSAPRQRTSSTIVSLARALGFDVVVRRVVRDVAPGRNPTSSRQARGCCGMVPRDIGGREQGEDEPLPRLTRDAAFACSRGVGTIAPKSTVCPRSTPPRLQSRTRPRCGDTWAPRCTLPVLPNAALTRRISTPSGSVPTQRSRCRRTALGLWGRVAYIDPRVGSAIRTAEGARRGAEHRRRAPPRGVGDAELSARGRREARRRSTSRRVGVR